VLWERLARPWQCCLEEAWLAYCSGSTPIGAAIADATGYIIARGRNRIYDAVGEGTHLHGHDLAHAEVNALVTLDYADLDRQTCALYTTTEPCPLYIKLRVSPTWRDLVRCKLTGMRAVRKG